MSNWIDTHIVYVTYAGCIFFVAALVGSIFTMLFIDARNSVKDTLEEIEFAKEIMAKLEHEDQAGKKITIDIAKRCDRIRSLPT